MSQEAPFNIDSGLSPLNAFLEFPEDKRATALKALKLAATYSLPSDEEVYQARKTGGQAQMRVENKYGDAADIFAQAIDPSFKGWQTRRLDESNSPETEELRARYYRMIRPLSAGAILRGVEEIKRLGLAE